MGDREELVRDANERLREAKIRWVQVQFVDLFGKVRCVHLPVGSFLDGHVWESGVNFDGSSIGYLKVDDSDMNALPDPGSLKIPNHPHTPEATAIVLCDIRRSDTRENYRGDPRWIARQADREVRGALGAQPHLLPEMEFFIFRSLEAAQIENDVWGMDSAIGGGSLKVIPTLIKPLVEYDYIIKPGKGYFLAPPEDRVAPFRSELAEVMEHLGFPTKYHHHENGNGQHEVEFCFIPGVVASSDAVVLFKQFARIVSQGYGFIPTFMPKPLFADAGSGMHVHIYLQGTKNLFYDPSEEGCLSRTARYFIGGILEHAPEMAAVTDPIINSYKRLVPEFEAPVFTSWSWRNRTTMVRVAAPTDRAHIDIEARQSDPSANPYLAFALIVQAGLDGIRRRVDCGEPVIGDVAKLSVKERRKRGIEALPQSLEEALDIMEESAFVRRVMGDDAFENYLEAKREEVFNQRIYVSPWEHYQYFHI